MKKQTFCTKHQQNKRLYIRKSGSENWLCRACHNEAEKRHTKSGKRNARRMAKQHNQDPETYNQLFTKQEGRCAICKETSSIWLSIDHDHKTGMVRGLLCRDCNLMLGKVKDRPEVLEAAAAYLRNPYACFDYLSVTKENNATP